MTESPNGVVRVLVVMAHPDDAEFGAAGTVARWAKEGRQITYVIITDGNRGSSDPAMTAERLAQIRHAEQRAAAMKLGVKDVFFLGYDDGSLQPTLDLRRQITRWIRRCKPDVVVCPDPTRRWTGQRYINHPDHRAAGDACLDAVYPSARDPHVFPELLIENLLPHKVKEVFMSSVANADVWIDITACMDRKLEGLREHKSQVGDRWDLVTERMKDRSRQLAQQFNLPFEFAEAYKYFRLQD
ncbi:MAG: PIG-L family deacetylase [Chloroflexi bacterium]|nr:MAG: PIG-L family deacetylase [Chloroflexota bacterium]